MKSADSTTSTPRMKLGALGEDIACEFLQEKGQTIIERNCRKGHLEIDIISLDKSGVHFVEVKSRVAPVAVAPEENVTKTKQKRIAAAAQKYLNTSKDSRLSMNLEINFDVVAIVFEGEKNTVDYFPNAYYPIYL